MSREAMATKPEIEMLLRRLEIIEKIIPQYDGMITRAEAAAITGLSARTVQRYGANGYFGVYKYANAVFFSLREICAFVQKSFRPKIIEKTTEMWHKPARGRPRKNTRFGGKA
jgi:hypothetical protein